MANSDQGLSPKQIEVLAALLAGKTRTAAAKEADIARATLGNWLRDDPAFKQALAAGQADLLTELNRRLLAAGGDAVDYLQKVLKRPKNQQLGIKASDVVLRRLLQTRDLTEFEERLLELEEAKGARDNE